MLLLFRTFLLTHDDHLLHNTFDSVAWRRSDRHQLGMSDFLRRNPQLVAGLWTVTSATGDAKPVASVIPPTIYAGGKKT
jgi:hypothetical protein